MNMNQLMALYGVCDEDALIQKAAEYFNAVRFLEARVRQSRTGASVLCEGSRMILMTYHYRSEPQQNLIELLSTEMAKQVVRQMTAPGMTAVSGAQATEDKVRLQKVVKHLWDRELAFDQSITEQGIDSLDMVEFTMKVEDEFGTTFTDAESKTLTTLNHWLAALKDKPRKRGL